VHYNVAPLLYTAHATAWPLETEVPSLVFCHSLHDIHQRMTHKKLSADSLIACFRISAVKYNNANRWSVGLACGLETTMVARPKLVYWYASGFVVFAGLVIPPVRQARLLKSLRTNSPTTCALNAISKQDQFVTTCWFEYTLRRVLVQDA
jgi:hypothetical protein